MSEPRTETGRRIVQLNPMFAADVPLVEVEAAALERERLLDSIDEMDWGSMSRTEAVIAIRALHLADPEDA